MKRIVKILILTVLYAFYKAVSLVYREKGKVVLMYHSVMEKRGSLVVPMKDFEKQLQCLKNNYQKKFLITFDDGYRDFKENAWPLLKKYQIPAVLFVHTSRSSHNLGNNWALLDWQEILELKKQGLEIGNHSHQHLDMKKLSLEELKKEMILSEEIFRQELGQVPKIFAYPGGKYNSQIMEFLNQRGYQKAFTIDEGMFRPKDDPFKVKRIGVGENTSMFEFKIRLTPAFEWYQNLRKLFRFKK